MRIRQAGFALRVVRRHEGGAAIIYRRSLAARGRRSRVVVDERHEERLTRVAAIGPLAFTAAAPLLREAVRAVAGKAAALDPGPFHPLDPDYGAKVACYAIVARGLRDAGRLRRAAEHLRRFDPAEAAFWLGRMTNGGGSRAVRALRILLEATQ